jgi:hypothetical protein
MLARLHECDMRLIHKLCEGISELTTSTPPGKWTSSFLVSAGVLLGLTGLAKVISTFGHSRVLARCDPLLGIAFNKLLLWVGLVEVVVALLCFRRTCQNLALLLVAALSANFAAYRFGLWLIHWSGYCLCLGTLTEAIQLPQRIADRLMRVVLTYLLLGSCACILWHRRTARKARACEAISPPL